MIAHALKSYYDEHIQHTASKDNAVYYEKKLNNFFGLQYVSDITQGKINNYVREWEAKGVSNGTIRRDLEHLQGALNHAVREQRLLYAPQFKKPTAPAPRDRILTNMEVNKLKKACKSPHVKAFVEIMLETGQRPGAVENLTWFQVDLKEGIIHFDRTGKKQTNKRSRPVPISDKLYPILNRLNKAKETGFVLEYKGEPARCVRKAFERACLKAGLKDVSRYTLRHTYVNGLFDRGVDDKTISDIAGHTNIRTTRHHYIKTSMDRLRDAVNKGKSAQKQRKNKKKGSK